MYIEHFIRSRCFMRGRNLKPFCVFVFPFTAKRIEVMGTAPPKAWHPSLFAWPICRMASYSIFTHRVPKQKTFTHISHMRIECVCECAKKTKSLENKFYLTLSFDFLEKMESGNNMLMVLAKWCLLLLERAICVSECVRRKFEPILTKGFLWRTKK